MELNALILLMQDLSSKRTDTAAVVLAVDFHSKGECSISMIPGQ